jgi:RNA polymerase sigma-70 factor (ECF subfamily)
MADAIPTVEQLLNRARAGDREAFAALFEKYRPLLHRVAVRLVGPDHAGDAVMESCIKAWQALPVFRGEAALSRWFCQTVRNTALDEIRRRNRRGFEALPADDETHAEMIEGIEDKHTPSPEENVRRRELGECIERAMAKLSEEHRTAILLREVDGLDYREIAAATGVSMGTVMSRLFNARLRLRKLLKEDMVHENA